MKKQTLDAYLGLMSMHGENRTIVKSLLSKQKSCVERSRVSRKTTLQKPSEFFKEWRSPTNLKSKKEAVKVTQFRMPL